MPFIDNREFIKELEKTSDVIRVKEEVDWDLEVGAILRRLNERVGPAVLFEKIKDYPTGYRIFGAPIATFRRLAIALGLPPRTSVRKLQEVYEKRTSSPIKPVVVKKAPCQERVSKDKDVDINLLPAPAIHYGDGGRYIGSWHLVIVKDPGSDWTNWGMYRLMIYNSAYIAGDWHPATHLGRILREKYAPQNKPMPVAIAIGADPLSSMMAATYLPKGVSESDYAGALMQKPIEQAAAKTSDILVPAHAEIIIEGQVLPDIIVPEGPFGEFPGYRTWGEKRPIMKIQAITCRKDPILTMSNMGVPVCEVSINLSAGVELKRQLLKYNIPVTDVYLPPELASMVVFVGVKRGVKDVALKINEILFFHGLGELKIFVVEDDINIFNLQEVFYAFASKCHPVRGVKGISLKMGQIFGLEKRGYAGNILTPFLSPEERKRRDGARGLYDCTWPAEWSPEFDIPPRVSFEENYPAEIKKQVMLKWKRLGFK